MKSESAARFSAAWERSRKDLLDILMNTAWSTGVKLLQTLVGRHATSRSAGMAGTTPAAPAGKVETGQLAVGLLHNQPRQLCPTGAFATKVVLVADK